MDGETTKEVILLTCFCFRDKSKSHPRKEMTTSTVFVVSVSEFYIYQLVHEVGPGVSGWSMNSKLL